MDGNKKMVQNAISLEQQMNFFIQQLISFVNDHDDISTKEAINQFFGNIIWSIEKMEWERMSANEKEEFIKKVNQAKRGKKDGNTTSKSRDNQSAD